MIETVATSRSNESFDEWILPGRAGRREHVLDAHCRRRGPQIVECVIAIVEQISRRLVPGKGLAKLLGRPRCRRMRGDRHVPDASPIVGEEHQDEPEAASGPGDDGFRPDDDERRLPSG
jgi:hypothetical protein